MFHLAIRKTSSIIVAGSLVFLLSAFAYLAGFANGGSTQPNSLPQSEAIVPALSFGSYCLIAIGLIAIAMEVSAEPDDSSCEQCRKLADGQVNLETDTLKIGLASNSDSSPQVKPDSGP